jgi:hypothetical protein
MCIPIEFLAMLAHAHTYRISGHVGWLLSCWPGVQALLVAQLAGRLNGLAQWASCGLTVEHVTDEDVLNNFFLNL